MTRLLAAVLLLAGCAPRVATRAELDRSPVGQFGIVRPPPIGCSETSGPPWNAARWVSIWDGDGGWGYCSVDLVSPHRVRCLFDHCERLESGAWRCGAPERAFHSFNGWAAAGLGLHLGAGAAEGPPPPSSSATRRP
jgi:hypothetical protein